MPLSQLAAVASNAKTLRQQRRRRSARRDSCAAVPSAAASSWASSSSLQLAERAGAALRLDPNGRARQLAEKLRRHVREHARRRDPGQIAVAVPGTRPTPPAAGRLRQLAETVGPGGRKSSPDGSRRRRRSTSAPRRPAMAMSDTSRSAISNGRLHGAFGTWSALRAAVR